jgi:hypothetical protein
MNWPSSTGEQETAELPTADVGLARPPGTQVTARAPLASAAREQCPSCGTATAVDQRYCVQCGQRLSGARPPFMQAGGSSASPVAPAPLSPRRSWFRVSPNTTLVAGIGTLLLAMGVGILIGRAGRGSGSSRTPAQILTIPSTAGTGAATTTPTTASTPVKAPTTSTSKSSPSKSSKPSKTATQPPNPTVKVGQKGSGKGYQHGKFTGHFFGGESEEEANEEPEAGKGSKSGNTSKTSKGK